MKYYLANGNLESVEVTTTPSSGETAETPEKELYVLANGIDNDQIVGSPSYMVNLENDLVQKSRPSTAEPPAVTTNDIIMAPLFNALKFASPTVSPILLSNFLIDAVAKHFIGGSVTGKAKDALAWIMESQDPLKKNQLTSDIRSAITAFFAGHQNRSSAQKMIAVGYSGGFAPLVEVLASGGYNVGGMVALGAAWTKVPEWLVEKMHIVIKAIGEDVDVVAAGLQGILAGIQNAASGVTEMFANAINEIMGFVRSGVNSLATDKFKQIMGYLFTNHFDVSLPAITSPNAEFLANIYGDKDILADLNIGGYRTEMGGFTPGGVQGPDGEVTKQLFNIQILGADHFDYTRRTDADSWNITVSDFVARLILAAKTKDGLQAFLDNQPEGVVEPNAEGVCVIDLKVLS